MRLLAFLILFGWAGTAWSQSVVNARVAPTSTEEGGTVTYELTLSTNSSDQDIELTADPDFGTLRVLQRTTMPSFVSVNGRSQRSVTYRWMLHASSVGEFQISGAAGRIGSDVLKPEPVSFTVLPKGSAPKKASKNEQVFVEGEIIPNRKHYVGEQITLNYQLYFDTRLRDIQPHPPDEPPLDEFWIEDMSHHASGRQTVVLDGRRMLKAALRSFALFPLRAGKVTIAPLSLPIVQGGFFRRDEIRIEADSIDLDIQPLPPGAPPGFHEGNVGQWKFEVTTDTPVSKVGSTVKVRLIARGYGLPTRLRLPTLPEPVGTRKLEPSDKNTKEIQNLRVRGERILEIPLLLLEEGTVEIPAVSFSWFDPQTATYHTQTTDPIQVAVAPGIAPPEVQEIAPSESRLLSKGDDPTSSLIGTLSAPRPDSGPKQPLPSTFWWRILIAMLTVAACVLLVEPFVRRLQAQLAPKRERRRKRKALLTNLSESDSFESLAAAIREFLVEILGLSRGLLSSHRIESALEKTDLQPEDAAFLSQTIRECDVNRFDPNHQIDQNFQSSRDRALQILSKIAVALLVTLATLIPISAHADGLEAYQSGDFEAALRHFSQHSDSPVAHHNLALANAQLERWGLARHHIEIAHLKAPFDSQIAHDHQVIRRVIRMRAIQETRVGRVVDGDDQLFWWRSISLLSENALAIGLLLTLLLSVIGLARRRKGHGGSIAAGGILLALLILGVWGVRSAVQDRIQAAVIVVDQPTFKEGPTEHANERKDIKGIVNGTMLRVIETRGPWTKLAFGESDSAWVKSDELAFPSLVLKGR